MNHLASAEQRRALRQKMRQARRALTLKERTQAARAIARHVSRAAWLRPHTRLAVYLATDEEIGCLPLIERALERRCQLYLPKITSYRRHQMVFAPLGKDYRLNRFGIAEPHSRRRIAVHALQIVFLPLVAFDSRGHRLGMGGGYYDRVLQRRLRHPRVTQPRLIGIAHSVQRLEELPVWPTDVPLDAVVTESGIEIFSRSQADTWRHQE